MIGEAISLSHRKNFCRKCQTSFGNDGAFGRHYPTCNRKKRKKRVTKILNALPRSAPHSPTPLDVTIELEVDAGHMEEGGSEGGEHHHIDDFDPMPQAAQDDPDSDSDSIQEDIPRDEEEQEDDDDMGVAADNPEENPQPHQHQDEEGSDEDGEEISDEDDDGNPPQGGNGGVPACDPGFQGGRVTFSLDGETDLDYCMYFTTVVHPSTPVFILCFRFQFSQPFFFLPSFSVSNC